MNVAFRADASFKIGSGHVMRCLTLANALKKRNAVIRFVCRHLPESLQALVTESGHELVMLAHDADAVPAGDLAHAAWLGTGQLHDADTTRAALAGPDWDWIVVDHYALDARWEQIVRQSTHKLMAIDDIADRHHDCDVLLDQNLHADMYQRYAGKTSAECRMLLGPGYALLRDEFRNLRPQAAPRTSVRTVLVFFGGVDAANCTTTALAALQGMGGLALEVDVVIGIQHPYRRQIEAACATAGYRCHIQTARMAELIRDADIAIGASGSASWERCCLGLPSVCVTLADNQVSIARSLHEHGACVLLGNSNEVTAASLCYALTAVTEEQGRLREMSVKALSLVDGCGADRVVDALLGES